MAKKTLESGISHAGDKLGKKAAEKSGDLIMKKLHGKRQSRPADQSLTVSGSTKPSLTTIKPTKPKQEDYNLILNRLISGNGFKR